MTEEEKTAREKANAPSGGMTWEEMMFRMCGECEGGGCPGMWGRWMGQRDWGGNMDTMARFMSSFTGTKAGAEEKTANQDAEKA